MTARAIRVGLALLLVVAAFFVAQRWLDCVSPFGVFRLEAVMVRLCSFGTGDPAFDAGGPGPMWWRPVLALLYLVVAGCVLVTKRLSIRP